MKASVFALPLEKKANSTRKQKQTLMNMTSKSAQFAALIGIDWASQRHALCLYDCATGKRESSILEHTPEAIAQWARGLQESFKGNQIALCLEQTQRPAHLRALGVSLFCSLSDQPGNRCTLPNGLQNQPGQGRSQ